ncbi:hypothetical protein [Symbioplanes lichenis]|uniref:hypothetical protein n=1 Tax=Symbioplanes lichenis TaxID=1629072 RepID=UPI002738A150|nr:hypothetical protein [Actinoplanes lichenis]
MNDLDQLAALDPMRNYEPTPERRARAAARLTFRKNTAPKRGVLLVAAAAAVTGVMLAMPGGQEEAKASWTTPLALAGADVLPQAEECARGWGADWHTPPAAGDVLLAERRADTTLLLVAKDGRDLVSCTLFDGEATGADLLDRSLPAPAPGTVLIETLGATQDDEWYSQVIGRTGAGVTEVDIELPDGTVVHTSMRSGWFVAWWPGHQAGEADGMHITVTNGAAEKRYLPSELYRKE